MTTIEEAICFVAAYLQRENIGLKAIAIDRKSFDDLSLEKGILLDIKNNVILLPMPYGRIEVGVK
jgi:hypothetical protein